MSKIWRRGVQPDNILTYKAILDLNDKLNSTDNELHDYVENRVVPGTYFYETEGDKAKNRYLWMRGLAIVAGAFVPVLVNISIPYNSYVTTLLSLSVVILVSLEGVLHYRERYRNYRSTSNALAQECYLMFMRASPYDKCTADTTKLRAEFVKRTEGYISREVASTLNTMTEPQKEETTGNGQKKGDRKNVAQEVSKNKGTASEDNKGAKEEEVNVS